MARCGCNTATSNTCEAIMSCVAANLGRGLDYNEATGQIDLRLSGDAGNIADIGSDNGLYVPETTGPGPMVWPKTVATLPADAISAIGTPALVGPSTAPELIEYYIANNIDIYSTGAYGVADGTVYESVGGRDTSLTTYTDNPGSIAHKYISSLTMQETYYDAGTRVNPTGRNSGAAAALLTPDGGWGGFYAPVYKPRTIDEMFRQIRGRIVVELLLQRLGMTPDEIEADIVRTVAAVVAAGAQEWVIIQIPSLLADNSRAPINTWIPLITGAGIAAGVNASSEYQMASPFTPAEIVASGATWVTVQSTGRANGASEARITALVAAGLQVVVTTDGRQYWTTRSFTTLGVRVVRSADPVYSRGPRGVTGDLNYRQNFVPGLATKTTATGALTPITDEDSVMWRPGFARNDLEGRWFPPLYGAVGAAELVRVHQLLGNICPIPNATNYRITLRVRRENSTLYSPTQAAVLFFASPDDRDVSFLQTSSTNTVMNGYTATLRTQPTSGTTTSTQLHRITGGIQTSLGLITGGASWRVNEWATIRVTVTPTGITFAATDSVTTSTITSTDTTWRGAYAAHLWDDQSGGYVHGYDNPTNLLMYEPLS